MRSMSFKIILGLILVVALAMPELVFAEEIRKANKRLLQEYQLIVTVILLSKSGHQESDGYNHFWRCSNGKETQAIQQRI